MSGVNEEIFKLIFKFAHRSAFLDWTGIFIATYLPIIMGLAVLILISHKRDWRERIFRINEILLSIILGWGLTANSLQFFYRQLRPFDALSIDPLINAFGGSFPSGHASILFGISMIVFYMDKRWGVWFFALSFLNGLARVFSGVHFPLDILAGAAIGVLSGFLVHVFLKPYLAGFYSEKDSENAKSDSLAR